ncbi:hypothetical protein TCAL_06875 [Tigriopus californicus]|uniref:BAG domain-containing protein n=1 Tax=Tigriopus californicus TaxID=6832 RepID=A0A553PGP7_TIGCA|nr:uncharacterized protein LOC131880488 isoform X2 [Tigriopus californicus]TRY76845.1 hypothetical protein TCAL_06875 [Tigriopus californicus]
MRQFSLLGLTLLLTLNAAFVLAQDEGDAATAPETPAPPPADAGGDNAPAGGDDAPAGGDDAPAPPPGGDPPATAAEGDAPRSGAAQGAGNEPEGEGGAEEGDAEEECEEAWEYVEFMKTEVKENLESILQDTLFQPRPLLEETVTKTMEEVLGIRDAILGRTKAIRSKEDSVKICPEQNIKQEEFLTQIRMQIMSVLLSLIEKDAATPEKLQDVGKQLLAIRTKVNGEITRMIMLRESAATTRSAPKDDCDCGILGELVEGLDNVINQEKNQDDAEEQPNQEARIQFPDQEGEDGADAQAQGAAGEGGDSPVQQLTMLLMTVDAEIRKLYNEILGELDDTARDVLSQELQDLKGISNSLHEALSLLSDLNPEEDQDDIEKILRRDVRSVRNDAKRLLEDCQQRCPGECDSCGAERIDEVADKLADYKANLEDLSEDEAKESIRGDLMQYLTQTNADMTDLLREKAENDELDECGMEKLDVINKVKGPLWMMVNITIFGDANTMTEMVNALEQALSEMRSQYCGPDNSTAPEPKSDDTNECDLEEINKAKEWISDIDEIIANDIFKNENDEGRRKAMLGLIDLKSVMDDRVRELFQDNLQCKEEVEQIKNIYAQKITDCLSEMMNPRYRFDLLGRAERVQCVKDLRILLEDRRGVLLMREIEARINRIGSGVNVVGDENEDQAQGQGEGQENATEG